MANKVYFKRCYRKTWHFDLDGTEYETKVECMPEFIGTTAPEGMDEDYIASFPNENNVHLVTEHEAYSGVKRYFWFRDKKEAEEKAKRINADRDPYTGDYARVYDKGPGAVLLIGTPYYD